MGLVKTLSLTYLGAIVACASAGAGSAPAHLQVPAVVTAPAQTAGAPPPPAAAAEVPPPELRPEPPPPVELAAWTDPGALAALLADCSFSPPKDEDDPEGVSPLLCESGLYEQACDLDPCLFTERDTCLPRCEKGCDGCQQGCTQACAACKAQAPDDAALRECARSCGSCKQACIAEKDRCASGACAAEYQQCNRELVTKWKTGRCPQACPVHEECVSRCDPACNANRPADCQRCRDRCDAALKRVCPAPLSEICMMYHSGPTER